MFDAPLHRLPDLQRVVLRPSLLRQPLLERLLRRRHHVAPLAEQDEARRRRALVDRADVPAGHFAFGKHGGERGTTNDELKPNIITRNAYRVLLYSTGY